MSRRQNFRGRLCQLVLALLLMAVLIAFIMQNNNNKADWSHALDFNVVPTKQRSSSQAGPCPQSSDCPADQFSFYLQSGAASAVAPKICLQQQLLLGAALNNAGPGINVVVINGQTGDVLKTGNFDMYSGDVKPLIELLRSIEVGSIVLMASFDEPSSKLTEEARKLIADLGSSLVHQLAFRDNWVFVGGKGATVRSNFEKHLKNDNSVNKYEQWPELIQLQGCIPKYLEGRPASS